LSRNINMNNMPILEFDPDGQPLIQATDLIAPLPGIPEHCVLCFPHDPIKRLLDAGRLTKIAEHNSVMGKHPLYELEHDGQRICIFQPGLGAPLAAGFLEELIARGCSKFIACGPAGSLNKDLTCGHLVVVDSAVRDEGTSYHYLPPSTEVEANPHVVQQIFQCLETRGVSCVKGKTWTTDAFYRETPARIQRRREQGCITVDMEASALLAVAQHRNVPLGVILIAADDVSSEQWDKRNWAECHDIRDAVLQIANECCIGR
jgi:uridine phosphorylase